MSKNVTDMQKLYSQEIPVAPFTENTMDSSRVACGIVTYNPDPERLEENLSAIAGQVDSVFIFDNASKNLASVRKLAEKFEATVIPNPSNAGMAVALNALAHSAIEADYAAILFLDQDSVASADLVNSLTRYMGSDVAIVSPVINYRGEGGTFTAQDKVVYVSHAITSGSLINLEAFKAIGGYDERLFVDWVDFDYCDNAIIHGFNNIKTYSTSILHELGNEEYAISIPRRDKNGKVVLRKYYRTNHSFMRRKDQARSKAIIIQKYRNTVIGKIERERILKSFIEKFVVEQQKIEFLRATILGYLEGKKLMKKEARK